MLKSERTESLPLAAHYGFSGAVEVLRALHRDSLWAQQLPLEDVYKQAFTKVLVPTSNATTYTTETNQMLPSVECYLPRLSVRFFFLPFSSFTSMA